MSKTATILNATERDQSGWQKAEAFLEHRLTEHRVNLEKTTTPAAKREALVWRIAELKELLRLGKPDAEKKD